MIEYSVYLQKKEISVHRCTDDDYEEFYENSGEQFYALKKAKSLYCINGTHPFGQLELLVKPCTAKWECLFNNTEEEKLTEVKEYMG